MKSERQTLRRLNYALGPIAAGMVIDAVDLVTFGPIGLVLGLPVGAAAGYWLGRCMKLDQRTSTICAVLAGIYCTIPGTELLPIGTLVGALVRFEDVPLDEEPHDSQPESSADNITAPPSAG